MNRPPEVALERAIGVRALAANAINITVGAGIFVLPAIVAADLGTAAVLAYLACATAMGLVLLCFAEAGSRVFESGGAVAYVEAAFGPFAGFLVSTLLWFGYAVISDAAVANALVGTVASAAPALGSGAPRVVLLSLLIGVLAAINIRGVRQGARAVEILTFMKLVPLVGLVCVGAFAVRPGNLAFDGLPTLSEFGAATLVLFFAFGGSESSVTPSGEIVDPPRTIPRGLLFGILGIVALYLSLQAVAQGVLGAELATETAAPLAATAERVMGGPGRLILLVGAAVSMLGTLTGDLLATPRAVFASARDGVLPRALAAVHVRYHTPHVAIGLYALLTLAFAITGAFEALAVLSSVAILLVYLSTVLATMALRYRDVREGDRVFRLPGGYLIPVLAAAVVLWILSQATRDEWTAIGALVAIAAGLYALRNPRRGRVDR